LRRTKDETTVTVISISAFPPAVKWATRARPHVDRCGTAWLIRRFIDPSAQFVFVQPGGDVPADATPFDMPGVEYGHKGGDCTFETTMRKHKLESDRALAAVARIVHDLDMHELKLPETAGLDAVLKGLKAWEKDDHEVLAKSAVLFESLYAKAKGEA
jgi:hypothetical protein